MNLTIGLKLDYRLDDCESWHVLLGEHVEGGIQYFASSHEEVLAGEFESGWSFSGYGENSRIEADKVYPTREDAVTAFIAQLFPGSVCNLTFVDAPPTEAAARSLYDHPRSRK